MHEPAPNLPQLSEQRSVTFANGIFAAYPTLGWVDICGLRLRPTQIRHIVTTLQHMRETPYRGVDRELFVDIEGIHLESCCRRGYIYIDDHPYTDQQCQELEQAALEAARCAEGTTFTSSIESYSVNSIGSSARQAR